MTTPLPRTGWLWREVASHARKMNRDNAGFSENHMRHGWPIFEKELGEAYERGFRCAMYHRPFGEADNGDAMDLDSRAEIIDNAHKYDQRAVYLVKTFVPWCHAMLDRYPELHIVPYVGSTRESSMQERQQPGRFSTWMDRFKRGIKPILDSTSERLHICFDHASSYIDRDPVAWDAVSMVRTWMNSVGREAVMEALPQPDKRDQHAPWPTMCLERFWWQRRNDPHAPSEQRMSDVMTIRVWSGHAIDAGAWGAVRGDQQSIIDAFQAWKADCERLGCVAAWNPYADGIQGGWQE